MKAKIFFLCIILFSSGCRTNENPSDERVILSVDDAELFFEIASVSQKPVKASSKGPARVEFKGYTADEILSEIQRMARVKIQKDSSFNPNGYFNLTAYFKNNRPVNYDRIIKLLAKGWDLSVITHKTSEPALMITFEKSVPVSTFTEFNKLIQNSNSAVVIINPTPSFLSDFLNRRYHTNFFSENDSLAWNGKLEWDEASGITLTDILTKMNVNVDTVNRDFTGYQLISKEKNME
ncbi:MAG: hypothetical protein RMK43_08425 [Cyclobacteriaceae bacterium]|nr:hypothetical protein [Cyclobacteriaceae bacterium]